MYRVSLTIEVEAEDEDEALAEAMRCDNSVIINYCEEWKDYDDAARTDRR